MNKFELLDNQTIISIDAESNGLWGQAFSVSALVFNPEGKEVDRLVLRCPIEESVNPWVKDNVLPTMTDIEETHSSYEEMLEAFFQFMKKHKDAVTLTHMGHIVEARLLKDAHTLGIIGDFEAPYLWYDVCLFVGDSTDKYNLENGLLVEQNTHNPTYDCLSAYTAFKHFVKEHL